MTISQADRGKIERMLEQAHRRLGGHGAAEPAHLPAGQAALLSNGLRVVIAVEPGPHAGQGEPDEPRLWLGVSRADRLPNFAEVQALIGLVFSASQRGSANPLSISTGLHMPFQVVCSSRISRR